ncbi:hypothetical protein MTO96_023547 [Rhipicephalus appendiculatus]
MPSPNYYGGQSSRAIGPSEKPERGRLGRRHASRCREPGGARIFGNLPRRAADKSAPRPRASSPTQIGIGPNPIRRHGGPGLRVRL